MLLGFIKFIFELAQIILFILGILALIVIFSIIGWGKVGIGFVILIACVITYIVWLKQKSKPSIEEQRYNEYMAKLSREVQRPIIQATLAKRENEPIDLGQIIRGKATFTDKNGEAKDLDISVNLKIK
ncbi:hypothetical protein NYR76_03200 [Actinobacillus equuli subsp. equuli]|uniref:hypothetical protein n=1 Tax=Actinobacillus equuli TaxID=718 RepID=UPI0024436822|nr:hypothetical protein [Actinobacillus equuli]WGE65982.1 hypothetical protein NYR76_03200 [Actinobacillus equuli subsp. equuli]